jgi:phosphoesterase RecJ-like protein
MQAHDLKQFSEAIEKAQSILILQPDKPDGDSVASALALEEIFSDLGKSVHHYTAGRVESYLSHLIGWDRIGGNWPRHYDLALLIDTGADEQIPRLLEAHKTDLIAKPYWLLDHHPAPESMSHLTGQLTDEESASTGEMIYILSERMSWDINAQACSYIVSSILADTMNLTNAMTTVRTVEVFAAVVKLGNVNLNELNKRWRETSAYDPDLIILKGQLLSSMELYANNQIALISASKELLEEYRQRTNLAALVFFDMLNSRGVKLAIFMNDYGSMIRTSMRAKVPSAGQIAEHFGGGGHDMAAAFPCTDKTLAELKPELIAFAAQVIHDQAQ